MNTVTVLLASAVPANSNVASLVIPSVAEMPVSVVMPVMMGAAGAVAVLAVKIRERSLDRQGIRPSGGRHGRQIEAALTVVDRHHSDGTQVHRLSVTREFELSDIHSKHRLTERDGR